MSQLFSPEKHLLYTRGFLGARANGVEISEERKKPLTLISLFDLRKEDTAPMIVNEEVIKAFDQLVHRQIPSFDFDYRERVIKIFLQAFGSATPTEWLVMNLSSPTFSHRHAAFVDSCLAFALQGIQRQMPVQTWDRMLTAEANNPHDRTRYSTNTMGLFDATTPLQMLQHPTSWQYLLRMWLSRTGGFSDLVYSLNIFFGDDANA